VTTSHSVEISASATATVLKLVELTLSATYGYARDMIEALIAGERDPPCWRIWLVG
jgi:hypothetical protein